LLRSLRIENLVLIREAELEFAPGLNALTGETGAGKTIFAQAIGLLLGARGDVAAVGPAAPEAYVEAELELPQGFWEDEELATLADLRPDDETDLVIARRVFTDGRTRAYAWGRAVAREDLTAAAERLVAMSGQFEQRRLARRSYQLGVLDAYCGGDQLRRLRETRAAWRELAVARRRHDELTRHADAAATRVRELEALVEDTDGLEPGEEDELRAERQRLRHVSELGEGASAAVQAIAPDEGEGAAALVASAERAIAPLGAFAAELGHSAGELRDLVVRLQEVGSDLHRFVAALEAEPERLEAVEAGLERIAEARRRFRCATLEDLLELRAGAVEELAELAGGRDPVAVAADELAAAEMRHAGLADELHRARRHASSRFAEAVAAELRGVGMGDGEFHVELREHDAGASGRDEAVFLIRPNPGLPFGPIAEIASGGELSRVALAIAAVGGGETLLFDEIDAGIGGETAHRVAATLARLAARAQVITITHLPQIASPAARHFRVEKVPGDPAHTRIEQLDEGERRDELERMLGGQEFLATVARTEREA
jgi:DNA repair protein RecN (Recombination protein N)